MSESNQPTPDPALRLALVITELGVGGAEKCVALLAQGIRRHQLHPQVFSLAPPPPAGQDRLVRDLESAGVPVHFVHVQRPQQLLRAVGTLTRLLRQMRPHVLQSFLFHANVVSALAARRARVQRTFAGLRVAEPAAWRWRLLRLVAPRFEQFVCVSQSVAEFVAAQGLAESKMTVIPNAVNVQQMRDRPAADLRSLGIASERRVILCVARLDRQKGVDWLLEQIAMVFQQLPDFDLVLAGAGPQLESICQYVNKNPWRDRVHLLGQRDDVPELMKASDLVVLPSRWEGMSNVLLEAMACRRPVVAHRVHGVAEVLGQLADQQTVEPGHPTDFVQQIVSLCSNRELATHLGEANCRRIEQHYTIDRLCAAYAQLYRTTDQCHLNRPGNK